MRTIKNIQVAESIRKGCLIYTASRFDKVMRGISYAVYPILIGLAAQILYYSSKSSNNNDRAFGLLYSLIVVPGLYIAWRLATEKRLLKVSTPYTKEENKQRLLQFAAKKGYEIRRQSGYSLVFNHYFQGFGLPTTYSIVLLPVDKQVLFTILTERPRVDIPALTSHLLLKRELKKFFNP